MIKFFKEIISAFKEGIEEGKQELAEEQKLENDKNNIDQTTIESLPYTERFGNALGAPFRVVIFGDWFTLFKKLEESTEDYYPVHLYTFGSYQRLDDVKKTFTKVLKRDFGIKDTSSCLKVLSSFFDIAWIAKKNTPVENIESTEVNMPYAELSEPNKSAVVSCIMSHITTAATDVGYLDKKDALVILDKTIAYVKQHHNNWDDYGTCFIEGQSQVGLNNAVGKSTLKKYVEYLKSKKGSPWNNLNWEKAG